MEEIVWLIFLWGMVLVIPLFAFYRGLCHGKARREQYRRHRIFPAIKHTLIWAIIGSFLFTITDSEAFYIEGGQFALWWYLLKNFGMFFLFFVIACGIPFLAGILLVSPQDPKKNT